jgi:N-methylhydantoinase B
VRRNGETVFAKGKITLEPGERLELELPGGGGWGDPLERPRELVENDLQQGLVTPRHARSVYGYEGNLP